MKNRNKSESKNFRKFFRNNRGLFFALGGIAAGIAIIRLLGTERTVDTLKSVGANAKEFGERVASKLQNSEPITAS